MQVNGAPSGDVRAASQEASSPIDLFSHLSCCTLPYDLSPPGGHALTGFMETSSAASSYSQACMSFAEAQGAFLAPDITSEALMCQMTSSCDIIFGGTSLSLVLLLASITAVYYFIFVSCELEIQGVCCVCCRALCR